MSYIGLLLCCAICFPRNLSGLAGLCCYCTEWDLGQHLVRLVVTCSCICLKHNTFFTRIISEVTCSKWTRQVCFVNPVKQTYFRRLHFNFFMVALLLCHILRFGCAPIVPCFNVMAMGGIQCDLRVLEMGRRVYSHNVGGTDREGFVLSFCHFKPIKWYIHLCDIVNIF